MAKSQQNGSTILLRLKGYEVEKVMEEEEGVIAEVKKLSCPWCGSAKLHRHGSAGKRTAPYRDNPGEMSAL